MSRAKRVEATHRIREFIHLLNEEGDVLMFLRRAGHTIDGYMQGQVGPRPLVCYLFLNKIIKFKMYIYV